MAELVAVEALDGERKRFAAAMVAAAGSEIAVERIQTEKMGERKPFGAAMAAASSEIAAEKIQMEKMDKAKYAAVKASGGGKRHFSSISKRAPVETWKAVDKIQKEKMVKTAVEVLDGEKNGFSTIKSGVPVTETGKAEFESMQTEEMDVCAESDQPAGVNGKHRLPDDYVALVLAMPREKLVDTEDLSFITDLAKIMNRSEDWIEERKKRYLERAALSKSINELFVKFQERVREEWLTGGDDEAEDDFDYDARNELVQKFHRDLWSVESK